MLAAALLLAGCSYSPEYAATLDDNGSVELQVCFGSDNLVVENLTTGVVTPVEVPYTARSTSTIDLGSLDLGADHLVRVWRELRYGQSGPGLGPELEFRPRELQVDTFLHGGQQLSPDGWNDICDPDDGLGISRGDVIALLLFFSILILGVVGGVIATVVALVNRRRFPR